MERLEAPAAWDGQLLIGDGAVVFLGAGSTAMRHAHDAIQLVWSFDDDITVRVGTDEWTTRACLVPAGVDHSFRGAGGRLVLLLIEPSGSRGRQLQALALRGDARLVTSRLGAVGPPPRAGTPEQALSWGSGAVAALLGREPSPAEASVVRPEVRSALDYVAAELHAVPRLAEAARRVHLSPSRLTHLFSAEVGMPFRRYVLWARMERVVAEVRRGRDLTTASAAAGFADSAHFSRAFKSMFGLTPSAVLPRLEIVGRG